MVIGVLLWEITRGADTPYKTVPTWRRCSELKDGSVWGRPGHCPGASGRL